MTTLKLAPEPISSEAPQQRSPTFELTCYAEKIMLSRVISESSSSESDRNTENRERFRLPAASMPLLLRALDWGLGDVVMFEKRV